jgi:hypothetical protein
LTNSLTERGHRLGLVLHLHQLHAQRQRLVDAIGDRLQGLAQRDDVAALGHGHPQRNHLAPWWRTLTDGGSA